MDCPDFRIQTKADEVCSEAAPNLGQRATRQRRPIFDILRNSDEHLDVESLYRKARDIDSHVSLSTVYRTVSLLKDSELVDELIFDDDRRFYEFRTDAVHHHIRCMSCGEIVEFESNCPNRLRERLEKELGFQAETIRVDVSGYCSKCRRR